MTIKTKIYLEKVVVIDDTEIVNDIKKANTYEERREIIKNYLNKNYLGKELSKKYVYKNFTKEFKYKESSSDIKHLIHRGQLDTTIALTQLDELVEVSKYIGESINTKDKNGRNDYFYYFKTTVEMDNNTYDYTLVFGKNRSSGNIGLYDINNYK